MADNILSEADLEALRRIQEKSKEAYRELHRFRTEVYPYMTLEDRTQFWAGEMERSLQWQEENEEEADEEIFDQAWYDECIGFDKDFDKILVKVAAVLGLDLSTLKIKRKK